MKKKLTQEQVYHIVCISVCVISLLLSFIVFFPCCVRVVQAVVDLGLSIGYLFSNKVKPSVIKIPKGMDTVLPLTIEEFKAVCRQTGRNFINPSYIKAFLLDLLLFVMLFVIIIAVIAVIIAVIVGIVKKQYKQVNTNHNQDTKPMQIWFWLEDKLYYTTKTFVLSIWEFVEEKKAYIFIFLGIWALNFNLLTIALETAAFVLYFIKSMDILNAFVQIAKFAVDINVVIRYMPLPIWCVIAYKIFDNIRREKGFVILEHEEALTAEVLENHPGNILATGKPRVGKTYLITYLQKLQARLFRRTAKAKSFERRMEFPFFPWIVLEQTIIEMRNKCETFNLEYLHTFIDDIEKLFHKRNELDEETKVIELTKLQEQGYQGHDFCFDYKHERFGLTFDNKAEIVELFECIHLYADHFYRYSSPSSGIFNNYPVRDYIRWIYYGNYPLLDEYNNELRVTTEELYEYSQLSHKYYFDMGRLGEQKDKNGLYNYNLEGGVIGIAEAGKEYGNQVTNKAYSNTLKDEDGNVIVICTPNNDLAPLNLKMECHSASVDGTTYIRRFMDEQRSSSLQADMLETLTEMRVLKRGEAEIKLPWFGFEKWLYKVARERMERIWNYMLPLHGENCLLVYWAMRIYSVIHNHYVRVYNQFSSRELQVKFIDHSNGEAIGESEVETMYTPSRPMAKSYETGYFGNVYKARRKRSGTGGNEQVPQYSSLYPNMEEMREVGSHFYDRILEMMEDEEEWTKEDSVAVIIPN